MAETVSNASGASSSIADSFLGISQDLAAGPSYGTSGAARSFSDWMGFGAGGAYGGELGGNGNQERAEALGD